MVTNFPEKTTTCIYFTAMFTDILARLCLPKARYYIRQLKWSRMLQTRTIPVTLVGLM
jgi:hypothetical protein